MNSTKSSYTGFIPYPASVFRSLLTYLIRSGEVLPGSTFLDLGAGEGGLVMEAVDLGLHGFGIEIHPRLVREGKIRTENERIRFSRNTRCELAEGSYYPPEYIELRDQGRAVALDYEDGIFWRQHPDGTTLFQHFYPTERRELFHPVVSEPNPFRVLGIGLQDIDLFFSYTWGIQLPSILELFSLYARGGSVLLNVTSTFPERHEELVKRLNLTIEDIGSAQAREDHTGDCQKYRKDMREAGFEPTKALSYRISYHMR